MFIAGVMLIMPPPGPLGISTFLYQGTSASHGIIPAFWDRDCAMDLGIREKGAEETNNERRPDAIQRGKCLGGDDHSGDFLFLFTGVLCARQTVPCSSFQRAG